MMMRTLLTGILLTVVAGCGSPTRPDLPSEPSPRALGTGAIVHLFEWRWDDVAAECEAFLGPAGYSAVQVSSPAENHIVIGRPWWERYQPVSYALETRSGTREEFAAMVQRCDAAGVDIYVDAVINHMADADLKHDVVEFTGTGTNGTQFGPFDYPGLYAYDDFNHCGLTDNDDIWDWDNREQVTSCELVDLADLDTSRPNVRASLVGYLQDLLDLGVAGFRIDAARHIPEDDLAAIADAVDGDFYFYQEVSAASDFAYYLPIGAVTDFRYGGIVSEAFRTGRLADLSGSAWDRDDLVPASSALVFIDNHDNQRGHGAGTGVLTFKSGPTYNLAVAFMLAYGRGRPRVMSSYAYEDDAAGPPADENENIVPIHGEDGVGCGSEWICEHRRNIIAGFVSFAAVTSGEDASHWRSAASDRIWFNRGEGGFVAFNNSDADWTTDAATRLPSGRYCNLGEGPVAADGSCSGNSIEVAADGMAPMTVPAGSAIALHVAFQAD